MAAQMGSFCDRVDAALSDKGTLPDPSKIKAVIRRNYEILTNILRHIEEGS
jgi:hypothetical protein